jgi:hypothetical protein
MNPSHPQHSQLTETKRLLAFAIGFEQPNYFTT